MPICPGFWGFLSFRHTFPARHAAAILCPLCGSERKKKNASRRRRFSLKFIDNVRARPASNIAVSRVNTGVSHPRPPHPGLSRVSQIRCLLTPDRRHAFQNFRNYFSTSPVLRFERSVLFVLIFVASFCKWQLPLSGKQSEIRQKREPTTKARSNRSCLPGLLLADFF